MLRTRAQSRRLLLIFLAGAIFCNLPARADHNNSNDDSQGNEQVDTIPPGATGKLQRGVDNGKGPKISQPKNLIDHGGPVRFASKQYFIWWGTPSAFPADALNEMTALAQGLNGSSNLAILNQYMRGATASTNFVTSLADLTPPPSRGPSTATIVNEVC